MCLLLSPPSGFIPSPWSIQQEEASQGVRPPLFSNSDAYTTISNMGQLLTPPAGFCSVPAQLLGLPCCIHSLWGTRPHKLLGGLPGPAKLQQRQHLGSKKGTSISKGLWGYLQHGPAAFSHASTCSEPAAEPRASSTAAPCSPAPRCTFGCRKQLHRSRAESKKSSRTVCGRKGVKRSKGSLSFGVSASPPQWIKDSRAVCPPVGKEHLSQAPETAGPALAAIAGTCGAFSFMVFQSGAIKNAALFPAADLQTTAQHIREK